MDFGQEQKTSRLQLREISPDEARRICRFILQVAGISINFSKNRFLETRLNPLLEKYGSPDYWSLLTEAKADASGAMAQDLIDAVATNETRFFRDAGPFELFQYKIIPYLTANRLPDSTGKIPIRIWSAACSTGQEVYSLAMCLKESLPNLRNYKINLLGSDISQRALDRAREGVYSKFEIARGLDEARLKKFFIPEGNAYRIRGEIREMVNFKSVNLLEPINGFKEWDLILCRNVAIYFRQDHRKWLFNQLANTLEPDGFLVAGASESLAAMCSRFIPKMFSSCTYYQRRF
ncbi:MCP methyltransferase (CheR-type) [Desulfatibacillum aliphaticivorans]|uniref:protein-glutamate O-methyltransferase n=2 Tax=Desulfatibacillum aliphaticivorans TaxID=218208 RepID=B8FGG2_DESAL|nr:MCP methyltransferase (CheR-type) [Desulfatibacillum aliphaticivorans]